MNLEQIRALIWRPSFDEFGDPQSFPLAVVAVSEAADEDASAVLTARPGGMDGRSPWLFFRLANGDLVFGCFPQGDTYFETEGSRS